MMFQTILDIHEVLEPQQLSCQYDCQQQNGVYLIGQKTPQGLCIQRIVSTNPRDYLNPNYQINSIFHK